MSIGSACQLRTQIPFGLARGFKLITQLTALVLALGEQTALLGEAGLELVDAPAEDLRLRGLRDQLAFEVRDATGQVFGLAALFGELLGGSRSVGAFAAEPVAGLLDFILEISNAGLERLDLGAQSHQLDTLAVGGDRTLVEVSGEPGELRFLFSEGTLGRPQRAGLDGKI